MKLKTLSCDMTVIKKNITRFFPIWGIYLIIGALTVLTDTAHNEFQQIASNLGRGLTGLSVFVFLYAAVAAQLLFGDLYNSRMCNALHAMPLRRERWYLDHLISGFLFFLIPTALLSVLLVFRLGEFWYLGFSWLGCLSLQYLFFFGLAVFSMFCAGNRLGMLAIYGILNFLSLLVQLFASLIYKPFLYGLSTGLKLKTLLSPLAHITSLRSFWSIKGNGLGSHYFFNGFTSSWNYLWIIAGIGVVLLILGLLLYRRRALEDAGEFITFKPIAPLFLIIYTLCWSIFFTLFTSMFGVASLESGQLAAIAMMTLGAVIGFFTGQMFLRRTVSVFKPKIIAKGAVLIVAFLVSLLVTKADPMGITTWVPKVNEVESVSISAAYYSRPNDPTMTEEENIKNVLRLHQMLIDGKHVDPNHDRVYSGVNIVYTMKDGSEKVRQYYIPHNSPAADEFTKLMSRPQEVFGYETTWEEFKQQIRMIIAPDGHNLSAKERDSLLDALRADCEAGYMADIYEAHTDENFRRFHIRFEYFDHSSPSAGNTEIVIYPEAKNTIAWMKAHYIVIPGLTNTEKIG